MLNMIDPSEQRVHTHDMETAPTHTIPLRLFELHNGDDTTHGVSDSDSVVGADDVSTIIQPAPVFGSGGRMDRYIMLILKIHRIRA